MGSKHFCSLPLFDVSMKTSKKQNGNRNITGERHYVYCGMNQTVYHTNCIHLITIKILVPMVEQD